MANQSAPGAQWLLRIVLVMALLAFLAGCRERAERRRAARTPAPETAAPEAAEPVATQPGAAPAPDGPAPEAASAAGALQIVTEEGGRLDWSHAANLIAFDRPDADGVYQIWTITPEGTNEMCLTCNQPDAPAHHKGNPAWHPSGELIVFQASTGNNEGLLSGLATPGMGRNNNLWLMGQDGRGYVQLTQVAEGMGVLHPHFSEDGSRLLWAEKIGAMRPLRGEAEEWTLRVADFVTGGGAPRLENIQSYQPLGPVFYESHGFAPDGSKLLFTAFLQPDAASEAWMDIYSLDLATGGVVRLTASPTVWDEHAHYAPDGSTIVWASSADCQCDPSRLRTLQMDLWQMQADGANPTRVTDLVASGASRNLAVDNSWGPDGRQIAVLLVDGNAPGQGTIALVTLNAP
jgi:Tol biopolymer transport system component